MCDKHQHVDSLSKKNKILRKIGTEAGKSGRIQRKILNLENTYIKRFP